MKKVICSQVRILSEEESELVSGGGLWGDIGRAVGKAIGSGGCGGTAKGFHDAFTKGSEYGSMKGQDYSGGCNSRAGGNSNSGGNRSSGGQERNGGGRNR